MKNRNAIFTTILLALASFGLSPQARASCHEGCFTYGTTVFGEGALPNTNASENTAIGSAALYSNSTGHGNTATWSQALNSNTEGDRNTAVGDLALYLNVTGD